MRNQAQRFITVVRWLSIAAIVAAILVMVRSLPIGRAIAAMDDWISGLGIWGPVVLTLVYAVATVLFVPGTILTFAAGAMFGLAVGTIAVSVGSTLGASLAFLIARYIARGKIARMASRNRHFAAIDQAIGEGGWKIVALLRLSPAIPFNLQNYLYGLTPIRFWPYVVASWLAMLPGTFLYVYLGHVTGAAISANRTRSTAEWILLAIGLLATVVVTVYLTYLASRILRKQTDALPKEEESISTGGSETPQMKHESRLRTTITLAAAAMVTTGVAAYIHWNAPSIERYFSGLFGPPRVQLKEAYAEKPSGPKFDHSELDALLHEHVDAGGWVDYDGLKEHEARLDEYLKAIAAAPFDAMGRSEKLALLINAYNAFTLKLIIEHQPIDSILNIPEAQRWDAVRWNVGGNVWSLNEIEHEQIRPKFIEPRIHFALVCAAVGCPPLRSEAYQAARLEEQLAEQSHYVHRHATWFRFAKQSNLVHLTKLYKWYGDDFRQVAGSELRFAARYAPDLQQALESGSTPRIKWLYNWKLNSRENKQPR